MTKIGFPYYDVPPTPTPKPTTAEIVASLSGGQKIGILNGYIEEIPPNKLSKVIHLNSKIINHLNGRITAIWQTCAKYMLGKVLITPAVIDSETGEVTTPAVYNDIPATIAALKTIVATEFEDVFTSAQVGAIIDKVVLWSKHDGTGTWTFYKNNVIL